MHDLIALLALAAGIPLTVVGFVMSLIAVKRMDLSWQVGMFFVFPLALPLFALIYWQRGKKPFIVSTIGIFLMLYTLLSIPDQ